MRPLLLVRPEPGLSASMERARALGLNATVLPLFEVVAVPWTPPGPGAFDAMLLTSANAVRHGGPGLATLADLPVHAVGEATAVAARGAGLAVASVGNAGVEALLATLSPNLRLFHPGGRHRTAATGRQPIVAESVYESRAIDPVVLPDLTGRVVAIHSARAGQRLAALVTDRSAVMIAAISAAAADACGAGWQSVETAAEPTDESLLALAAKLCQTGDP